MTLTVGFYFAIALGAGVIGMIGLVAQMQKENEEFVKELQFFLKHRTIGHNKAKAQIAILQSQFDKLKSDYDALRTEAIKQDINFSGLLEGAEFLEKEKKRSQEEGELFNLENPF